MMLPQSHPHAGLAMEIHDAMSDDITESTLGTRLAKAKHRIEELESLLEHFMSLTHPQFGRAHDHPEYALRHLHARLRVEVGDAEDLISALEDMEVSDRAKPTRADLEAEGERLQEKIKDCHTALNDIENWFKSEAFGMESKESIETKDALRVVRDIRLQSDATHDEIKNALDEAEDGSDG